MKKSVLFMFGMLLLFSLIFSGCANHAKKVVDVEWLYASNLDNTKLSENYRKLTLSSDGNVTYEVKEKRPKVYDKTTGTYKMNFLLDKKVTGTYKIEGDKLTISFNEEMPASIDEYDERINEIRSTFYRFKVQNSYLLITNVTDVSFRSPFVFVKKAFVESNFAKKSS